MTPKEFYQRIDEHRDGEPLAPFIRSLGGKDCHVQSMLLNKKSDKYPTIEAILVVEGLFTTSEVKAMLEKKLTTVNLRIQQRLMAEEYLKQEAKTSVPSRKLRRELTRQVYLERAWALDRGEL